MTSTETGGTWSDRLNPRNWTLVWKLAVVGLLPALLALSLGVLRVADQAGDAADLGRSTRLLDVQQEVAQAANSMRQERDRAVLFVAESRGGDRGELDLAFQESDGQLEEMLTTVRGTAEVDATTIVALQQAESELNLLPRLRGDTTDNQAYGINQVRTGYTELVEGLDVLDRALLRQLRTPGTAGLADALSAATSTNEQLAIQHTLLGAGIKAGRLQPGDAETVTATENQISSDYREYQVALTPDQLVAFGTFLDAPENSQRERLKAAILAITPDRAIPVTSEEWDQAFAGARAAIDNSSQLLRTELVNQSTAAEEAASNEAGIQSVILMLGLLAGITVAILVARALIRSLRVLRTAALDVAERRLPQAVESMRAGESPDVTVDPVPIGGADEVGQVARAFDAVHGQAVRLAAEQAALQSNVSAMFVNLSRRSQALVERQLQLIEQLESNEQDPDQLSNLFQLDHLATRMRRNSENLLVLAGTDLAKRNAAPIPLVDVLRAAVSEVEQYQRIVVQSPPTATVAGRAGADLVHLLAELLDNATNFSPPDSQVVMSSARTSDGSVVIEINDRGVGMLDHELDDANHRLAGPSSVDVSASRRMGLFVVGRLGARHGVAVRLGSSAPGQGSGLTASVTVPAYLISATAESGRPMPGMGTPASQSGLPQRTGAGSAGPNGSLSSLVAGTDGPANPTSVFDAQAQDGAASLGGPPPGPNGNPVLPTRRPGSTLRPNRDGPPLPPGQEPGPTGPNEQPPHRPDERERAREIAEQARRDQEAAARRTAQQRQNLAGRPDAPYFPGAGPDRGPDRNGFHNQPNGNGTPPSAMPAPSPDRISPDRISPDRMPPERMSPPDRTPPERQPQNRADTVRPDTSRPDIPRPELPQRELRRPEGEDGRPTPADDQRSGFSSPPLPRRIPGQSPQPPSRPGRDSTDDGGPRSLQPGEPRPRPEQQQTRPEPQEARAESAPEIERPGQDRPTEDRRLPQLPQRVPQSELTQSGSPQSGLPQSGLPQRTPSTELPRREPRQQPGTQPPFAPVGDPRPQPGRPAEPAPMPADALFSPVVPAEPAPDGPPIVARRTPADAQPAAAPQQQRRFDPSETTPIFEEIASAWFRSNRQIPVAYEAEQGAPAQSGAPAPAAPQPTRPQPVGQQPTGPQPTGPQPTGPQPQPSGLQPNGPQPAARPAPAPAQQAPAPMPLPQRTPAEPPRAEPTPEPVGAVAGRMDRGFATEADDGWRAASGAVADRANELTTAGLPKRRPRARLVPGSAGSAVLAAPASPARSAENIRGRLASYQQGVRQGRERRLRGETAGPNGSGSNGGNDPANAGGNHDEESS